MTRRMLAKMPNAPANSGEVSRQSMGLIGRQLFSKLQSYLATPTNHRGAIDNSKDNTKTTTACAYIPWRSPVRLRWVNSSGVRASGSRCS